LTAKVISLTIQAGIQRDGTQFSSLKYVDGLWVRFQRGLPRKIGGYNGLFQNATGISRGMIMQSQNGINYVYSGQSDGVYVWQTNNTDGVGSGPTTVTMSSAFSSNANNLWQWDVVYDSGGSGALTVLGHPGQNLNDISSTVNTPVMVGQFPYGGMTKLGIFTASTVLNSTTTATVTPANLLIATGQSISGTGIPANTTITAVSTAGSTTTITLSQAATSTSTQTLTYDNNISVSGGVVVLYPYTFVYGNNGLIQNNSAGNLNNWVGADSNANNVSGTKVVKGMPLRGGTTSPAGLFWSIDQLTRVTYAPQTVGTSTIYWRYDIISTQTSIMSSQCVIEYDGIFYWCGVDRFLMYNGVVQEIPNDTNQNYFFDNLNYAQRQKVWVTKVPRFGEIWWFYPSGNSTECNNAIIYNVREKTWYDAGFAIGANRSAGVFSEVFRYPIWSDNISTGYFMNSVGIVNGGTSYQVGDVIQVNGGTGSPALLSVASVSTGVVTALNIIQGGNYSSSFTGTLTTTARSPSMGSGLTIFFTLNQAYTLWQHEIGVDQVYLTNVDAIQSYFETNSLGWVGGGPGNPQLQGDNVWIRVERVEPDFIQNGDMNLYIKGKGYADDQDVTSQLSPYTFSPTTLKIDMKEQYRELRMRYESNTYNGTYQMGRILISADIGDVRGTGNP
jgi:hypothetical protein